MAIDGLPRCLGNSQRGGGPLKRNNSAKGLSLAPLEGDLVKDIGFSEPMAPVLIQGMFERNGLLDWV